MTNDTYCVTFKGERVTERYYRDRHGWLKVSNRGRVFRMTAEQVLNHLLPALAFGERHNLTVTVEHTEAPYWQNPAAHDDPPCPPSARSTNAPQKRNPALSGFSWSYRYRDSKLTSED